MSDPSEVAGPIGKILAGESGLGTVTPEMVEQRAVELARMDGRTEAHNGDRERAHQELLGPSNPDIEPEEVNSEMDSMVAWDESTGDVGSKAPQILPEDEANIGETLVQEGLEEAEHDQRLSAVDDNPPEEDETP